VTDNIHTNLPGWTHFYSGKVRELYVPEPGSAPDADEYLLVVTSNRVSAFDHLLEPPIPEKGAILTALSRWWFAELDVVNHLADGPDAPEAPAEVRDRAMVTKKLDMFPIECVVRGAITGSGYAEYLTNGSVCGVALPEGLSDGDLLDEPIFTPAYKAPLGEHDENITMAQTAELVGEDTAEALKQLSLDIFSRARDIAAARGLVLADTKFEFGRDPKTGELVLADEVLTSDSSRFWDAAVYKRETGAARMESFDKQIVRNWLKTNWDGEGTPPVLPDKIVERTRARYEELYERLTGSAR